MKTVYNLVFNDIVAEELEQSIRNYVGSQPGCYYESDENPGFTEEGERRLATEKANAEHLKTDVIQIEVDMDNLVEAILAAATQHIRANPKSDFARLVKTLCSDYLCDNKRMSFVSFLNQLSLCHKTSKGFALYSSFNGSLCKVLLDNIAISGPKISEHEKIYLNNTLSQMFRRGFSYESLQNFHFILKAESMLLMDHQREVFSSLAVIVEKKMKTASWLSFSFSRQDDSSAKTLILSLKRNDVGAIMSNLQSLQTSHPNYWNKCRDFLNTYAGIHDSQPNTQLGTFINKMLLPAETATSKASAARIELEVGECGL